MNNKIKICNFCGKRISSTNYKRHIDSCKLNPVVIERKLKNIHLCKKCGKEFNELESSTEFCSIECSRSYSSLFASGKKKIVKCIKCNKDIEISSRASAKKAVCDTCKKQDKKQKKSICQYCGREISNSNLKRHEKSCTENKNRTIGSYQKRNKKQNGYIYIIINNINKKSYIGKRIGEPDNSKNYYGSGIAINRAIRKYGKNNFTKDILEIVNDGNLEEREVYWISFYNTYRDGYNMTEGGEGGSTFKNRHHSEKTKNKIRESMKTKKTKNNITAMW